MRIKECCAYVFRSLFLRGSTKSKSGEPLLVLLWCDSLKSMHKSELNCTADLSGRGEETDRGWVTIESVLCLGPDVQRMNPPSFLVYRKPSVKFVMTSFGWWRQDQCSSEYSRDQWDPVQAQSREGLLEFTPDVKMAPEPFCVYVQLRSSHTGGQNIHSAVPFTVVIVGHIFLQDDVFFIHNQAWGKQFTQSLPIISFPKIALLTCLGVPNNNPKYTWLPQQNSLLPFLSNSQNWSKFLWL